MTGKRAPQARNTTRRVNVQEAADQLGVCTKTVRNMIAKGELPAVRVGGRRAIRIDLADLERVAHPIPSAIPDPC